MNKANGGTTSYNGHFTGGHTVTVRPVRAMGKRLQDPTKFFLMIGSEHQQGQHPNHLGELVDGPLEVFGYYRDTKKEQLEGEVFVPRQGRVSLLRYSKMQVSACKTKGEGWYLELDPLKGTIKPRKYP